MTALPISGRAAGGFAGTAALNGGSSQVEILPAGQAPSAGFGGASVQADALAALGANRLVIGALPVVEYGQGGRFYTFQGGAQRVILRSGAQLATPEILVSSREIEVEAGAGLSTLGRGAPSVDSTQGYAFQPGAVALLALSNGRLDVLAPDAQAAGSIRIGTCAAVPCPSATGLYSEGTIAAAVNGVFDLGEAVRYGTRNLTLAVGAVNVGTATALEQAAARGVLPSGLTLNQEILAGLLRGDVSSGAPGLEVLTLTARDAINFYGSVALDTRDPASGRYSLAGPWFQDQCAVHTSQTCLRQRRQCDAVAAPRPARARASRRWRRCPRCQQAMWDLYAPLGNH
ncbi:hypothetical protein [Achromobacter xylosoxidans]|uniref:hypothetical protein n=1 Tax=Alcaligenes xylosoxydans xylosoxydans TaxID=85698 RepID=UPI001F2DAD12|nr:hypothetical protein [Achromobacter xylosoxidans]